jgi:hypothetical protein
VDGLFNLKTISFVLKKLFKSCSPIYPSLLLVARFLEFYWGSPCLFLLFPIPLLFLVLTAGFLVWY